MQVECRSVKITIYFPYQSFSFTFIAISKLNLQCIFRATGSEKNCQYFSCRMRKSQIVQIKLGRTRQRGRSGVSVVSPWSVRQGLSKLSSVLNNSYKSCFTFVHFTHILSSFVSFISTLIKEFRSHHNINVAFVQLIRDKDAELKKNIEYLKCIKNFQFRDQAS